MSSEHKNFEDRLRNRILNEELPYDAGAWEGFQNQQVVNREEKSEEASNSNKLRIGFWRWLLLAINLLIVVSVVGFYFQNQDNVEIYKSKEISQIDQSVSDKATNEDNKNIESDDFNPKTKPSETFHEKGGGYANHDKSTNGKLYTSGVGINSGSISSSRESGYNGIDNKDDKVFENVNSEPKHIKRNGNVEKNFIVGDNDLRGEQYDNLGNGAITDKSKVNANLTLRGENLDFENSIEFSKKGNSKNSLPLKMDPAKGEEDIENINLTREVSFASIGKIEFQNFVLPEITGFDMPIIIKPLKYKKNEFYIGTGFVNNFSEFTTRIGTGRASREPTYYSLGYYRKVSPSWSLGIEAHIMHLQNLPMSTEIRDYHQTSISFEYIDGIYRHLYTNYIGLPITIKYQPLGIPIGLYGGLNLAYTFYSGHGFENEHYGDNTVINNLRGNLSAAPFYKNWDAGLIAGATIKIWKGLELEGRAVFGLVDVSDDYFWGESTTRTSHYRVGLKYKFLK